MPKDFGQQSPPHPLWYVRARDRDGLELLSIYPSFEEAWARREAERAAAPQRKYSVHKRQYHSTASIRGPSGTCEECLEHAHDLTWFRGQWLCRDCLCPPIPSYYPSLLGNCWMKPTGRIDKLEFAAMNSDWLTEAQELARMAIDALPLPLWPKQRERMTDVLVREILAQKHDHAVSNREERHVRSSYFRHRVALWRAQP